MKKKVPAVFLTVVAIAIVFLASKYGSSFAATIYPELFEIIANNEPRLQVVKTKESIDQPAQNIENQLEVTLASPDEEIEPQKGSDLVKEMVQRWKEGGLPGSGWVHFVYRTSSSVENGVFLPDGNLMPRTYLKDGWYFLNDQGLVEKDVVTLKDEYGNVLQQASFANGIHFNLTLDEKFEGVQYYELKLDLGLLQRFSDMEAQGVNITTQDIDYKGKLSKEFSATGVYQNPAILNNSPLPVESITLVASFDNQSGAMNWSKTLWKLTDGTEVIFEEVEIVSLERVEAPDDIIAIMESVK